MIDESGGIMKVYDVNGLWRAMDKGCQEIWASTFGGNGNEEFVQACVKAKKLVIAPPGKENAPKFKGKSIEQVFSGPLFGFVGQGKDATKVASFGEAIDIRAKAR